MNSILQKCLEELRKPKFRKDYVVGMLETLIEMQKIPDSNTVLVADAMGKVRVTTPVKEVKQAHMETVSEASLLDAAARIGIEKMKAAGIKLDGTE